MSKETILKEFIGEFCNDHNGNIRFLRGIFYDEQDGSEKILDFISKAIDQTKKETREETIKECKNEDFSDGYHTFKELYEFRKVYNASLFNEWYKQGKFEVHKSKKHFNGEECFGGGWFVVVAILPTGQISNHYELKDWDLFKVEEVEMAKYEFDGHTSQDVLMRLKYLTN